MEKETKVSTSMGTNNDIYYCENHDDIRIHYVGLKKKRYFRYVSKDDHQIDSIDIAHKNSEIRSIESIGNGCVWHIVTKNADIERNVECNCRIRDYSLIAEGFINCSRCY